MARPTRLMPLDWAISRGRVWQRGGLPPAHLLRRVFETCADYAAAKTMLCDTPLALPTIFLLAGVYFPIQLLPLWLRVFAYLLPLSYALQGLRFALMRGQTLAELWPYAAQLLAPLPDEAALVEEGYIPDSGQLRAAWEALVLPALSEAGLAVPGDAPPVTAPRHRHTQYLAPLLAEMQEVARLEAPETAW